MGILEEAVRFFDLANLTEVEEAMAGVRRSGCRSHKKRCHRLSVLSSKQWEVVDILDDIREKLQQEEFVVDARQQ